MFLCFCAPATTQISTLSLHDALPISAVHAACRVPRRGRSGRADERAPRRDRSVAQGAGRGPYRSEEHTSELQSQSNLVCRLLLEKKKIDSNPTTSRRWHRSALLFK